MRQGIALTFLFEGSGLPPMSEPSQTSDSCLGIEITLRDAGELR